MTSSGEIQVPSLVGSRFQLLKEQGRGTSGVVFKAQDTLEQRPVALKLLLRDSKQPSSTLLDEAAVLQGIEHANIVKIFAAGVLEEGQAWLAMEWLEGEGLDERIKRAPLSPEASLRLIAKVADALHAAHSLGIVHRDIKPANIFLLDGEDGTPFPKILDFGSATRIDRQRLADSAIIGTPAYMAPEQVRGDTLVDARCDLYSLGATLYELLSGQPPHRGPTHLATLARLATTRPRRLRELRPEFPKALDEFVLTLLATAPQDRPVNAAVVAEGLRELADQLAQGAIAETEPRSSRLGSAASRVLTTIVALDFPNPGARDQALPSLSTRGVEAIPLAQDSLVAHLGARHAQGNEATSALRLGQRLARAGARVGVATGRALVPISDLDAPPIGEVVDRAIGLARNATGGQLLADATTTELGRGRYEFVMRADGSSIIKGKLTSPRADTAGGTPFVGRNAELSRLKAGFNRALSESRSLAISISGAPGIGKTRLQREAIARLGARSQIERIVHQRHEAYGQRRALGAAADIVRSLLDLPKGADLESCRVAFVEHTKAQESPPAHHVDILVRWITGQELETAEDTPDFRDTLWRLMTLVVSASLDAGPVLMVCEDLQWTDPESVAWLEHLLGRFREQPLILLFTARNTFWRSNEERFNATPHVRLELHPISDKATRAIAAAVVGGALSEDAAEKIVEQAAGSPLFAEELSRLAAAGKDIALAPTLEAAIQVSLDALTGEQRNALDHLSVLGLAGWDETLEAMGCEDPERTLTELCASEVLVETDNSRFFGLREWHFKHALVRDVTYNSLGDEQKKELHALAAEWFERVQDDAAIIARHFDLAEQPERAANHWAAAARRALATNALSDALSLAERALAFAEHDTEAFDRARLLDEAWSRHDDRASDRESAISAMEEHAYDDATRVYARGARARYDAARGQGEDIDQRLTDTIADSRRLTLYDEEARCAADLARRLAFAGDFDRAEAEAARLLELSREEGMRAAAVDAWQTLAIVRQSEGAIASALDARRNAVAAAQNADLTERESMLTTNLGFALTTVGARREAREYLNQGLKLAEEIGSLGAKRHALMLLLCWAASFGSDRDLDAVLGELREEADDAADGMWTAPARENLGNLYYRGVELLRTPKTRNAERARNLLRVSSEAYRQTKNRDVLPVALGMWGKATLHCGEPNEALTLAQEAADLLDSGAPSLLNESVVYVVLHDAQQQLGNEQAAVAAVEQGMPPLLRRLRGLATTPYVLTFLTELADNAALIANAELYGVLPERIREVLGRDAG